MPTETAPVRPGEELDIPKLTAWLGERFPGIGEIQIEQFPNGHSNLVYLVRAGSAEYVLRRPPLGPVPPKAHDMAREYRILDAVNPHFPEAPRVFFLCEDPSIAGATFFLMERRRGTVLRIESTPSGYARRASEAFVDCLIRLHAVDISTPQLSALGKPEGFVERQVLGWSDRWRNAQTEPSPEMDAVVHWLRRRLPPSLSPTIVHNDFKLDNVMLRPDATAVEAVLDWEMATIGDPMIDLGLTLCYWSHASTAATPTITTQPGWFTRNEFVEHYARATGRDMTHLRYHEVLGIFKLAVILQQIIFFRFHKGQTHDERFRKFDARVRNLVHLAAKMVEHQA